MGKYPLVAHSTSDTTITPGTYNVWVPGTGILPSNISFVIP
jgi:hypothetical protein